MRTPSICLAMAIVLFSPRASTQWIQTNGPYGADVRSLAVSGANLFAGTGFYSGVFLSTDSGTSWTEVSTGLTNRDVWVLAVSGTNLFAGTTDSLFLSSNSGTNWTAASTGLTNTYVTALTVSGTNLFAGTGGGVFRSTNNGANWDSANTGLTNTEVRAFAVSGTNIFAGTWGDGVFHSTNNGTSWTQTATGEPPSLYVNALVVSGKNLWVGAEGGVFHSANNGASWDSASTGLPYDLYGGALSVYALAISDTNLYAGTYGGGVCRRPLSEMTTGVEANPTQISIRFALDQNYPNPFNPSTTIRYALPHRSNVKLTVCNTLGQTMNTLVNGEMEAGYHSVRFDGSGLASGVYMYRLQAGDFVQSRKLLLLR